MLDQTVDEVRLVVELEVQKITDASILQGIQRLSLAGILSAFRILR